MQKRSNRLSGADFSKVNNWQAICMHLSYIVRKIEAQTMTKKKLFCKQCFREDTHSQVQCPPSLKAGLVVITLGLALFFWPARCVCCGTVRLSS